MSSIDVSSFRPPDSTCTLSFSSQTRSWVTADSLGTIHQMLPSGEGKMSELTSIIEEPVALFASNPSGDLCVVGHGAEADIYSLPGGEAKSLMIARRDMPLTHAEFDNAGNHIFVSSRSPDVSIYSMLASREEAKISTSGVGVRSFAVSPSGEYIGILDEDRSLCIFNIPAETGVLGKKYLSSNQEHRCGALVDNAVARNYRIGFSMSWHPSNLCLAAPADKHSISLFQKTGPAARWAEDPLVFASEGSDLQHSDAINIVRFSPNGMYLASADVSGTVLIWDMAEKNPIRRLSLAEPAALFDVQWGREANDNYIIVLSASSSGKIDGVIDIASGKLGPCAPVPAAVPAPKQPVADVAHMRSPVRVAQKPILSPPPADIPSAEEKHRRIKKLGGSKGDGNKSDDDDLFAADAADESIEAIKQQSMKMDLGDDDGAPDAADTYADDVDGFAENQQFSFAAQGGGASDPNAIASYLHNPIEPGSTPFDEKHRRYMAWNLVGSIVCREEDSGNRIEIKFADISGKNKNFSFVDSEDFSLAALSYEGAFFANQPEDPDLDDLTGLPVGDSPNTSDKKGSDIRYHAFSGQTQLQGANETFSMTLPVGEIVDCLAVGQGWAAAATSKNLLRIFSSTGLQLSLTWLRGPVVCTTGFASQLAVFYNDGGSLPDGSPNLAVELFHITSGGVRQEAAVKVPVSPGGSLLQWASFSEDGILFAMDTAGMLSSLMMVLGGWRWIPLLDTAKASKKIDHKFWPICVKSSNLCYVLLNGESKPLVYPQPVVSVKPLNPPIVEVHESRENKEKAEAENTRIRNLLLESCILHHLEERVASTHDIHELEALEDEYRQKKADTDKVLLQMFQESCRLQRNAVSSDIALRLHTPGAVEIAITIAEHFKRPGLARLLENVLRQKQEDELADQQLAAPEEKYSAPSALPPARPKQSAPSAPIVQHTPPREYHYSEKADGENQYDDFEDPAVVTPGERQESSFVKKKNLLNMSNTSKPLAPPVNRFAQGNSLTSPTKKRPLNSHEDLKSLRSSPSPVKKKPALSRDNSFAREARTKQANDRNALR